MRFVPSLFVPRPVRILLEQPMVFSPVSSVEIDESIEIAVAEPKASSNGVPDTLPSRLSSPTLLLPNAVQRVAEQRTEALIRVLDKHRGDRHLVVLQDFPDPDAMASAWAYKLIAERFEIQCELVYGGTLSHQENIALVKLSGLPLQRWNCQTAKGKDLS
ncbi:MAG: hypothetical protein WCD18_06535, partial [Thermosynechococcaceae cyanobacterium]